MYANLDILNTYYSMLYLNKVKQFCPSFRGFNVLLLFSTHVQVLYFTDILTHLVIFNQIN